MPSYNERLTANNQKIDDITTLANELPDADEINEKIDAQDTIIENLKSALDEKAGKGGGEPNIFVQLEEPTTKKGIWLQKEAEPEHYTYDDEVFIGGEWEPDGKYATIPFVFYDGVVNVIGNYAYVMYNSNNYKYDFNNNTWTKLTNVPINDISRASSSSVGSNIYVFFGSSRSAYKYDTITDTWTKLINIPYDFYNGTTSAVGTDIYLFGGANSTNTYKYDTLTDTYTAKRAHLWPSNSAAVTINTDIYLFGSAINSTYYKDAYKYDTITDTWTKLTNIPYDFYKGGAAVIGTDIYLFGCGNSSYYKYNYKYDTLTDTYTQLNDMPSGYSNSSQTAIGVFQNSIYIFSYPNIQCLKVIGKTYEQDNLVVINQGKYASVGYEIELYNNSKDVTSPKYAFVDAWYYTLAGGLETDIPTYYGDGTQWINIKNPINNGGGE